MQFIKSVRSGDILEIYRYEKTPNPPKPGTYIRGERRTRSVTRTSESIGRTRKNFLRLVRSYIGSLGAPALVTLTMHSVVGIEVGYRCFTYYMADLKRYFGQELKYIAVPEFQERGAVHFHILVWGLEKKIIFNETPYEDWLKKAWKRPRLVQRFFEWCEQEGFKPDDARGDRLLQNLWSFGFVDCVPTDGAYNLAGYLAKYMRKSMHDERLEGRKAYVCSRGVVRPVSESSFTGFTEATLGSFLTVDSELLFEKEFDTLFLGRCHYKMLKLSRQS